MRETRARLDRRQWLGLTGWTPALIAMGVLVAGFFIYHRSARDERQVAGTVESADWRLNDETGHVYPFIEVKLDSGASVRIGDAPVLPAVGDRITLRQRAMLFDYMTVYEWDGPGSGLRSPPAPTRVSHP
ncbi:hypothetical protein [Hyphomicrobium sp.]|uniref:hypothetical protein n=1 Tax=Hyphomicrobium sp. TaxID=82 RepID=UPI0025C46A65|nr:hypothetical protein [Hyphomicrobium sp.]MCC7251192.1 hypothetical protein [Hyphomicrobium sp.]